MLESVSVWAKVQVYVVALAHWQQAGWDLEKRLEPVSYCCGVVEGACVYDGFDCPRYRLGFKALYFQFVQIFNFFI